MNQGGRPQERRDIRCSCSDNAATVMVMQIYRLELEPSRAEKSRDSNDD